LPSDSNYVYKAYIETLLNYGDDASRSLLELQGWHADTNSLDDIAQADGLIKRKELTKNSKVYEVIGSIHASFFNQPLFLLNGVEARINLLLNKPDFYFHAADGSLAMLRIVDATLYLKYVFLNPSLLLAHQKVLQNRNAKYFYNQTEIKQYVVAPKGNSLTIDNVVIGKLPKILLFYMVDNSAYVGKMSKNPLNFKHNNINNFALYINGKQHPGEPIEIDFSEENDITARAYSTLFASTGLLKSSQGIQISKSMYKNGYFILAFDLRADSSSNSAACTSLTEQGTIRIEARFSKPLSETINCMVHMEFDACVEIDKNRNVFVE
jgi:hypothetical protein